MINTSKQNNTSRILASFVILLFLFTYIKIQNSETDTIEYLNQQVEPGGEVSVETNFNILDGEIEDSLFIQYFILDGKKIVEEYPREKVSIYRSSFAAFLPVSEDISPGVYTVSAKVFYDGKEYEVDSDFDFKVRDTVFGLSKAVFFGYVLVWSLGIAMIFYVISLFRKKMRKIS